MRTADRFVVLGLAPVRSAWFRNVARWSNEAVLPISFIKTISAPEVEGRLAQSRAFSALLVDALAPGLDRDLIDTARSHGCAVIVVDPGLSERDWRSLGVAAVLPETFDGPELLAALRQSANPIGSATKVPDDPSAHARPQIIDANTIAVTGTGGIGTTTVAMAIAQGLATEAEHRRLCLVDMALRADLALTHDVRDVVPALTEVVDAHRLGTPENSELARLIHDLPDRQYHLLLGLRSSRDWMTISGRALEATWTSLENLYRTIVVDCDDDFDGAENTGSGDLEDRNRLARTAVRRSRLVVAVGSPNPWGLRRLVLTIRSLLELDITSDRILPCVNRAPRQPRARAEITRALAELIDDQSDAADRLPTPVFLPERRALDDVIRDGSPLPNALVEPIASAVAALTGRTPTPEAIPTVAPVPVAPGTLGTWSDDDA